MTISILHNMITNRKTIDGGLHVYRFPYIGGTPLTEKENI